MNILSLKKDNDHSVKECVYDVYLTTKHVGTKYSTQSSDQFNSSIRLIQRSKKMNLCIPQLNPSGRRVRSIQLPTTF